MSDLQTSNDGDHRVVRDLLESIGRDGAQTQRRLAQELGIALGLVNAYLKRCIGKGFIKVRQAPARRYAYYLTPTGFAEKSRLTMNYLSYSMGFFRLARKDCGELFGEARRRRFARLALVGKSDLAEICIICGLESGIEVAAVVDPSADTTHFLAIPVVSSFDAIDDALIDAVVITDMLTTKSSLERAIAHFGSDRVLVPDLLRVGPTGEDADS
jgi:DNA-binding MarR family transcriptional regulator